jgi:hypothetical protein
MDVKGKADKKEKIKQRRHHLPISMFLPTYSL